VAKSRAVNASDACATRSRYAAPAASAPDAAISSCAPPAAKPPISRARPSQRRGPPMRLPLSERPTGPPLPACKRPAAGEPAAGARRSASGLAEGPRVHAPARRGLDGRRHQVDLLLDAGALGCRRRLLVRRRAPPARASRSGRAFGERRGRRERRHALEHCRRRRRRRQRRARRGAAPRRAAAARRRLLQAGVAQHLRGGRPPPQRRRTPSRAADTGRATSCLCTAPSQDRRVKAAGLASRPVERRSALLAQRPTARCAGCDTGARTPDRQSTAQARARLVRGAVVQVGDQQRGQQHLAVRVWEGRAQARLGRRAHPAQLGVP